MLCRLGFHRIERRVVTFSFWPMEQGTIVDYCTRGSHIHIRLRDRIAYLWDRR